MVPVSPLSKEYRSDTRLRSKNPVAQKLLTGTAKAMLANELQSSVKTEVFHVVREEAGSLTVIICPQEQFCWYEHPCRCRSHFQQDNSCKQCYANAWGSRSNKYI